MFEAALDGSFKGIYIQGEDLAQSDPNTQHVTAALAAMECVVVQDLFLNETAKYAHVFLPGSSFLEKDGTFTNAERRISRVRKVMEPLRRPRGLGSHGAARRTRSAIRCTTRIRPRSWTRSRALTPTFTGVSYEKLDRLGSIQWPCNDAAPEGTPTMHVGQFVRGKGKFFVTEYVPTQRAHDAPLPAAAHDRPHPHAVQRRRADAPHGRTSPGTTRIVSRFIRTTPRCAASRTATGSASPAAPGDTVLRAVITDRVQPGVVYTTFHFPGVRRQRRHDRELGLGDQLPRVQGDGGAGGEGDAALGLAAAAPGASVPARRRGRVMMDIERLVAMANDIAAFFDAEPDKAVAAEGVRFT